MDNIYGLCGMTKVYESYLMSKKQNRPILFICHNEIESVNYHKDLTSFMPAQRLESLPTNFLESKIFIPNINKIQTMKHALNKGSVVASIDALLPYLAPASIFKKSIKHLAIDMEIEIRDVVSFLVSIGYTKTDIVTSSGEFALRGDILDLKMEKAYRIEFFDNVISSIRYLNTDSQRSEDNINNIDVLPMISTPVVDFTIMKHELEKELKRLNSNYDAQIEKMKSRLSYMYDCVNSANIFNDIENFAYYLYNQKTSFVDYMQNPIIIIANPEMVKKRVDTLLLNYSAKFASNYEKGQALLFHENFYNTSLYQKIEDEALGLDEFINSPNDNIIKTKLITVKPSQNEEFYNFIKSGSNFKTYIFCGSENRAKRFIEILAQKDIGSIYIDEYKDINVGQIACVPFPISGSYEHTDLGIRFISDQTKSKQKNNKTTKTLEVFTDINEGDYVVHAAHGIGRYIGIKSVTTLGNTRDYLAIEYSGGSMLYLEAERMDRLQKYIGAGDIAPKLSKIGGSDWVKTKAKVKKSVEEMAEDLIKLYAQRSAKTGYAFGQDTSFQTEFEDDFEYEETDDQEKCIREIKSDMESNMIMDRLLCGDVGYGKTEVALRAMFKCVMDGKQAALLVPTVVLAKQHYNTIVERMEKYAINISLISRNNSAKEQKQILTKIKDGEIDIIVGTHKLLNDKIEYKDLGLLVIDEEQRFGVKHKEKIKKIKNNIDVLTLSATPIPRTLYMSLIGVRDISTINTPPSMRQTIATYVVEYDDDMVCDAIMEEVNRGGKVYFLYNNVEKIDEFAYKLSKRMANIKIGIGHGQMSKENLEKVMLDFYSGNIDVLVCSTIIESGLDVYDANTIIIYDADKLGLSQLYQLRGRVGRGEKQAFAYFTYRGGLSEKAFKRLSAIKDFTDFGSGFKIAMRDLEIRGAGNILGESQSGNLSAVGYDMYCKLIESAVNDIRGIKEDEEIETVLKIDVDAYIPKSYIESSNLKIETYKKIACLKSEQEAREIKQTIEDRFGKLPKSVIRLFDVAILKANCQRVGIICIKKEIFGYIIELDSNNKICNEKLILAMKEFDFNIDKDNKIKLRIKNNKNDDLMVINNFVKYIC